MARSAYSEVVELLLDRMKNLSKNINISFHKANKNKVKVFNVVEPEVLPTDFFRVEFLVTSSSEVEITNYSDKAKSTHDFSASSYNFAGYEISLADGIELREGDQYTIVNNDSTLSFDDVRTFKKAVSNSAHPFIEIYPNSFSNREVTTGRTRTTNVIDIAAQIDLRKINYNTDMNIVLDVAADIENEIMRDPRFGCKVIDSAVTQVVPYLTDNTSNIVGVVVTVEIKSKHLLADASALMG